MKNAETFFKVEKFIRYLVIILLFAILNSVKVTAQDFMMQGWYWDYPKTVQNANWADTLRFKTQEMGDAGFTLVWLPPLSRTSSGNWSNGYDPKDLYDYGEFGQGATGFGTRSGVDQLIAAFNGSNIKAVADVVYNHRDGGGVEDNPGLKNYTVNFYTWEKANSGANPFPYDRMRVVLPLGGSSGNNAGDYYFKFRSRSQHSKFYNWEYKIYMYTDKVGWQGLSDLYESEPNGGGDCGQTYNTVSLGRNIMGNIDAGGCGIDEFKLTLSSDDFNASGDAIYILFNNRSSGYSDLYIHGIWSVPRNANIVNDLYYQTYTNYNYVPSGQGQMNWSNFKPNQDRETYLAGEWDSIYFYYDYDQFQTDTRNKLFDWTRWNWNNVGIRGFRMDAIKHFTPEFVGDLLDNLYDNSMIPPMVVGEWYGTNTDELAGWVNNVYNYMDNDTRQAIAPRIFDFSLREALRQACDQYGYNVRGVFDAGIVDQGKLNGMNVVTFVNNHDFREGSGFASLIQNDAILAYAYILTNNQLGIPTVFYPDYFGYHLSGQSYYPPYKDGHKAAINQLIGIHKQYIYGASGRTYLNKWGSGFTNSAGSTNDQLLVYQLKGSSGFKDIVVVINFSGNRVQFSQQLDGIAVGTRLSDLTGNSAHPVAVVEASANGVPNSIWIDLPGRSYSVWRTGAWGLYDADRSWIGINQKGTTNYYRVWNSGAGNIQNTDLGTFTGSDVLQLAAFDIKTWKQSGGDVTGGSFYYTVYPKNQRPQSPVFTNQILNWIENIGGESTGNQKWGFSDQTINILSGLSAGEYTIEFYARMNGNNPEKYEYDSNNGNNFLAHFRYNYVRSGSDGNWNTLATWLDEIIPDNSDVSVEINHHVVLNDHKEIYDLKLFNGSLILSSAASMTANGSATSTLTSSGFLLQSDASGSASLIHTSPGVPAKAERFITGNSDAWHLLSSPVTAQEIGEGNFSSGNYSLYLYSEPHALWVNYKNSIDPPTWLMANGGNTFVPGRGYLVSYNDPNTDVKNFTGLLNTGIQNIPVTKTGNGIYAGSNLIGNPYASSIDWKAATGWSRDILTDDDPGDGSGYTMHIWNHTHNNYGAFISNGSTGTLGVTQFIPPAQGFFVTASSSGELQMTDQVRVHHDAGNWLKKSVISPAVICIRVSHPNYGTDEVIIEFNEKISGGAGKMMSMIDTAPSLWLTSGNQELSILFKNPSVNNVQPLSFKAGVSGTYTFEFSFNPSQVTSLVLEDLLLMTEHDLMLVNSYTFSSQPADNPDRFLLKSGVLGIESSLLNDQINISTQGKDIIITTANALTASVFVYHLHGRLLYEKHFNGESHSIQTRFPAGIYIVRVVSDDQMVTKKVLIF